MENTEIALTFIKHFCSGDIDAIEKLLTSKFKLRGPVYKFNSSADYIENLRIDPPEKSTFIVNNIKEKRNSVEVVYDYFKESKPIRISQIFIFDGDKISKTILKY